MRFQSRVLYIHLFNIIYISVAFLWPSDLFEKYHFRERLIICFPTINTQIYNLCFCWCYWLATECIILDYHSCMLMPYNSHSCPVSSEVILRGLVFVYLCICSILCSRNMILFWIRSCFYRHYASIMT